MGWEGWCNKITRWDGRTAVQRNGTPDGATIIDHRSWLAAGATEWDGMVQSWCNEMGWTASTTML
jgi:hypothetical protein